MNPQIVILGAGESGMGAAMLAKQQGYAVWVSEGGGITNERKELLQSLSIPFEEGGHDLERVLGASLIIKSPGISPKVPIVQAALNQGITVVDELEFASRFSTGKIVAITGTNGKTTTTLLTYHLMKEAGLNVGLAGNVGKSWAAQLATEGDKDWWVLETSSFQIDGFTSLKPTIGILTNITPDHLDRYDYAVDKYVHSKMSLFARMHIGELAISYADDVLTKQGLAMHPLSCKQLEVSLQGTQDVAACVSEDSLHIQFKASVLHIPTADIAIKGKHNMLNAMMAVLASLHAGGNEEAIRRGLKSFQNAPHRMELVANLQGVKFINDSKGTNVDATAYALESYASPVIWIAGGVDKGNDYLSLFSLVEDRVVVLICLGKANDKLKQAFTGRIPVIRETQNIKEAVEWAFEMAQRGTVVLLSPACASFDLFQNYEDRGEQFKKAVLALNHKMS
jgi:UDP-N-acetylmuramoylalanine--D-glutamate ligase